MKPAYGTVVLSIGWYSQLPKVICQNCWLPTERIQLSYGSSVLESSFIGDHNQGLPKVPGLIESLGPQRGFTSLIRALRTHLDLIGTLVRASLVLGGATYPGCQKPPVLPWHSLAFLSFLLALLETWPLPPLKDTYCRSPSSTGLLEPPASCGDMPKLLAPNPQVCWNHELPMVVCQNYWLPGRWPL
jgi:hypothetical protein